MNIVANYGLRECVLWTERRPSADGPASVWKRRHRLREVFCKGIARKYLVSFGDAVVNPNIELVLVVGFVAETVEIVGQSRGNGLRVAVEQRGRRGIERNDRNEIAGVGVVIGGAKNHALTNLHRVSVRIRCRDGRIAIGRRRNCAGRCAVERRSKKRREISTTFRDRGNSGAYDASNQLAGALVIGKEKSLVADDGAAKNESKLIAAKLGLARIGRCCWGKKIASVQNFVP